MKPSFNRHISATVSTSKQKKIRFSKTKTQVPYGERENGKSKYASFQEWNDKMEPWRTVFFAKTTKEGFAYVYYFHHFIDFNFHIFDTFSHFLQEIVAKFPSQKIKIETQVSRPYRPGV